MQYLKFEGVLSSLCKISSDTVACMEKFYDARGIDVYWEKKFDEWRERKRETKKIEKEKARKIEKEWLKLVEEKEEVRHREKAVMENEIK